MILETEHLKLVPATVSMTLAEIGDHVELTRLLGATVPDNWPPETLVDALPLFLELMEATPDAVGWFGWYALAMETPEAGPVLVGSGGFKGPPRDGMVEIGYAVLPQFWKRGYATEMVGGLVRWAFEQGSVERVEAEIEWANLASVRVLRKAGFAPVGRVTRAEGARFVLAR